MSGLSWCVASRALVLAETVVVVISRSVVLGAAGLSVTFGDGRRAMWLSRLVGGLAFVLVLATAAVLALRVELADRFVVVVTRWPVLLDVADRVMGFGGGRVVVLA